MMVDQRTMVELYYAPTEGYAEAIVVPPILAEHFELKHNLINMMTSDQFFRLEKENPHDYIRSDGNSSSSSEIAKPTHAVNQQTSAVNTAVTAILKPFQATPPPASVKSVEEICVTYGGAHPYCQCLAADGNTFLEFQDNIQGYVSAAAVNYNQGISGYRPSSVANQIRPPGFAQPINMMASFFQMNITSTLGSGPLLSNTIANSKGELKAITTQSGLVLDGPSDHMPPPFINLEETLTDPNSLSIPLTVILKKLPEKLRDPGKFLISCGFSELKCKALADLGASNNFMPLSVWKKLGLSELIFTRMTLELANRVICTSAGIAKDVFVLVGKFTFPADFVIVDYESDPRVPLILGRPFLQTAHSLIDVQREEIILCDGDERLTLNMRHDTSSYSNQPHKESINMINMYNDSYEDYLEDLFATNHISGNPTFSSHTDLTSPKVINPLSGNTTSSSPDLLLEEFADELAVITFLLGNDDLPFDIEFDLREIEYLLNHDPTKEMDSILEDSVDECNLADPNNDLFDTIPEMFTDEHTCNTLN
nr:hypothetical protein [Tanacetum cinerariifolium]